VDDDVERYANGTKKRADGKMEDWNWRHRVGLGKKCYMEDVDHVFAAVFYGQQTSGRLFVEYEPDNGKNIGNVIRKFAIVAIIDKKETERAAFHQRNVLSLGVQLAMCRMFGAAGQPKEPKFFFAIGGSEAPWKMIEIDIHTGERTGVEGIVESDDWGEVWKQLGIDPLRQQLRAWIDPA
jgi:hypothetical protein